MGVTGAALGLLGLTAAASWWLTGRLARVPDLGTPDLPNERSLHATPVARTGGVAIIAAVALALVADLPLVLVFDRSALAADRELGIVLLGAAVLSTHAYWSDFRGVSVAMRLGVQLVVATATVLGAGLTLDGLIALRPLAVVVTVLALVWMTNLYNFMDGMDGFAGGMTILGFAALAVLGWRGGQSHAGWLSLLVAASAVGFLIHNFPPARIFLGDVGSIPLGFLAGSLSLLGVRDRVFDVWTPVLIFSPFVVDATVTLARRLVRGERVWRPHREHYYQRLVLAGWGHRRTVLVEYGLMLACGATAAVYVTAGTSVRVFLLAVWATVYCSLAYGIHAADSTRPRCP
jgi:UDP-N-acetylmuramyl pentapeptide phosphotransferase/UDP-N-acetylglucosamine-1-phosphate transferase